MRYFKGAALAGGGVALTSTPALAHHVMDGQVPDTLMAGLLSGFGHPIIGVDHFAFIVGIGLVSALIARRSLMPLIFIAATVIGCTFYIAGVVFPVAEVVVSASLVVVGALVMRKNLPGNPALAVLFGLAGLFHGWAYGAGIVGAEATPLAAYLVGFAIIQYAIALGTSWIVLSVWKVTAVDMLKPRLAGAVVAGIGIAFFVEAVEGMLFA